MVGMDGVVTQSLLQTHRVIGLLAIFLLVIIERKVMSATLSKGIVLLDKFLIVKFIRT